MSGEPKTLKELRASRRVQPYLEEAKEIQSSMNTRAILASLQRMYVASNPAAMKKEPKLKVRIPRTVEREADIRKLQEALSDTQAYRDAVTYQTNIIMDVKFRLQGLYKRAWGDVQEWKGWNGYQKRIKDLEDAKSFVFLEIDEAIDTCDFVLKVAEEIKWNLKSTMDTVAKLIDAAVHDYHRGNKQWK